MKGFIYCFDFDGEDAKVPFDVTTPQELAAVVNTIGHIGWLVTHIGNK